MRFTLVSEASGSARWTAVMLRLQGPSGRALASGPTRRCGSPGALPTAFTATVRLGAAGVWRGWVDVEAADGAILAGARPALHVEVSRAPTGRGRAAARGARDSHGRLAS